MLFELQVGVHPDSQPLCRLFVELEEAVSYLGFSCKSRPEVQPIGGMISLDS
jgi:hypothetical protein